MFLLPVAASAEDGIIVQMNDGTEVGFAFSKSPTIVTSDSVQIETSEATVKYPYANVQKVYWGEVKEPTSAIGKLEQGAAKRIVFRITADGIEASGLQAGEHVSLYGIDGAQMASGAADNDGGSVLLQLPTGQRGVYIVRTGSGVSYKFIKK